MTTTRTIDMAIVLFCAIMWGLWWYPVQGFEAAGLTGPWIGFVMSLTILPVGLMWSITRKGSLSGRAIVGAALAGTAFMLYAIAVSYTDFLRAVLLFYLAPIWSTLIELIFLGRRWNFQCLLAIVLSLAGVLLVSRGEISFDGLGAIGDWMALASGITWSAGAALVFSSRKAEVSRTMVVAALGGAGCALVIAAFDGSMAAGIPDFGNIVISFPFVFVFSSFYVGIMMAGTMWGAFQLPPATMTYLLSVEILAGVFSAAVILGERFGWFEIGGTICILTAALVEVLFAPRVKSPVP